MNEMRWVLLLRFTCIYTYNDTIKQTGRLYPAVQSHRGGERRDGNGSDRRRRSAEAFGVELNGAVAMAAAAAGGLRSLWGSALCQLHRFPSMKHCTDIVNIDNGIEERQQIV